MQRDAGSKHLRQSTNENREQILKKEKEKKRKL